MATTAEGRDASPVPVLSDPSLRQAAAPGNSDLTPLCSDCLSPAPLTETSAPGRGTPLPSLNTEISLPTAMEGPAPGPHAPQDPLATAAAGHGGDTALAPVPPSQAAMEGPAPGRHAPGDPRSPPLATAAAGHGGDTALAPVPPSQAASDKVQVPLASAAQPPAVTAPGGGQLAILYLCLTANQVFRLIPSWTSTVSFEEDVGFAVPKSARLLAMGNEVTEASVFLSQLSETDSKSDVSYSDNRNIGMPSNCKEEPVSFKIQNILEVLVWSFQNRACLKVYSENGKWCSTTIFYMKRVSEVAEIASLGDFTEDLLEQVELTDPVNRARFLGCSKKSLEFAPLRMRVPKDIMVESFSRKLGIGAQGIVGRCFISDRPAALKVCRNACVNAEPREVKILAEVHHPNVLQLYCAGPGLTESSEVHICTKICDRTLLDYLNGTTSAKEDADRIMVEIMSAIKYLHSIGIVHRDIKPENIMFDADGRIRLIDFGHANFLLPTTRFMDKGVYGTELYAAPELIKLLDHNEKVDVYSAGMVSFELYLPITRESTRYAGLRDIKKKMYWSTTWNNDDLAVSWNKYPFAKGWRGNVKLLKHMIRRSYGGRASATEVLETLVRECTNTEGDNGTEKQLSIS